LRVLSRSTRPISYTPKKVNVAFLGENLVNVEAAPNIEESATSKFAFLLPRDRTKATVSKVACMGRVVKTKVEKIIGSKLTSENVLYQILGELIRHAKEKGIEHYRIKSNDGKYVIKGLYHIQNVNGLHSRMKQWIERFKGVSTKYLDNYLAWFLFVDSRSNESTKHNIKDFLLSSFVFEMTDTYDSLRKSKFIV
jgi:hypothetical protein